MNEVIEYIILGIFLSVVGILCFFIIITGLNKEEIWEELIKRLRKK